MPTNAEGREGRRDEKREERKERKPLSADKGERELPLRTRALVENLQLTPLTDACPLCSRGLQPAQASKNEKQRHEEQKGVM